VSSGAANLRRWWCKKYKRPSNDPLLLELSEPELLEEWYEDLYAEKRDLESALEEGDVDYHSTTRRLRTICEALEESGEAFYDPLIDKWEEQLARGEIPDLTEGLDDG